MIVSETQTELTGSGQFTCVVDNHPRLHLEAVRWFVSLTELAGVDASDLVVHVVGPDGSDALNYLRSQGVRVRPIDRFDGRSPHCNKIAGALRMAEDGLEGLAVLCDADVAVLDDPRHLEIPEGMIAAKTVDTPLPPLHVLNAIFAAAGIPAPPDIALPWGPDQWTKSGNCNGGIYVVPGSLLARVSQAWSTWARWLLDRSELLEDWSVYIDQVAMAIGLASEGIELFPLDVRWNTPTHDLTRIPDDPPRPSVIHYHQEVERNGRIRTVGRRSIDGQIEAVNQALERAWPATAVGATERRWLRSLDDIQGDTGSSLEQTRNALGALTAVLRLGSTLLVGEVDPAIDGLDLPQLAQLDAAEVGVGHLRTATGEPISADLVICLDYLLGLEDLDEYCGAVEALWQAAGQALVVSGLDDCFDARFAASLFHEALRETLRKVTRDAEVYPVATDGSVVTYVVLRTPEKLHPRDFVSTTLDPLVERIPDATALMELRLDARRTTGFYPDHSPRLWEYPVVARLVTDHLPRGSRLIDVGAGVSPVGPFLAGRGYVVDTVDPSPVERSWEDQAEWNEWYYLDYAAAGLANRSWNSTLGEVPSRPAFDGVYSVSVIEHMPGNVRRSLLADISTRTRAGGLVVLTIDLIPDSDDLWNFNLGVQVEQSEQHGTFQDVVEECAQLGLEVFRKETVRAWPGTHVDIGLLALRQTRPVPSNPWRDWREQSHSYALRWRARRPKAR